MISLNDLFVLSAKELQSDMRALPAIAIADAGWAADLCDPVNGTGGASRPLLQYA
jgi:hypothetical protein